MSGRNVPGPKYWEYQTGFPFAERDDSSVFRGWSVLMYKPGVDVSPDIWYYNATWPTFSPSCIVNYLEQKGIAVKAFMQVPYQRDEQLEAGYEKFLADQAQLQE